MKFRKCEKWFRLLACISLFSVPAITLADATDTTNYPRHVDSSIQVEYFNIGNAKSNTGNAEADVSGVLVETEYEKNDMVFSFNYERWNYNWKNPENLPYIPSAVGTPSSTFNTLQFGFAYEQEINQWEFNYYVEAESSYEKETSQSNEYEAGVDFVYEQSENWVYTLNLNLEYLDATGAELGADIEIEWNHDKKEGWSGEFEISSEFPETSLTYHFTKAFSTTIFYNESGTNTIRLSDSTPINNALGDQGVIYFEDEYNSLGIKLGYEFSRESYLTFTLQQNSGRTLSFSDAAERADTSYALADTVETTIGLLYTF